MLLQGEVEENDKKNRGGDEEGQLLGCCTICWLTILSDVMMCPECSALYCTECLEKCKSVKAQKSRCSSCRQQTKDFARCRSVESMIAAQLVKKKDVCGKHGLEKVYFCRPCREPFCPTCLIEDGEHDGHGDRVNLTTVYSQAFKVVKAKMEQVKVTMHDLQRISTSFDE